MLVNGSGSGRNGALEALDQLQRSVSEGLRSFGRWLGSVPVGFVLDNVSDFIRNAVGLGLRMGFFIWFFPLWWEVPANPGVFQVCLGLNFGTSGTIWLLPGGFAYLNSLTSSRKGFVVSQLPPGFVQNSWYSVVVLITSPSSGIFPWKLYFCI